ncbi:hypothetical protein PHLCEN_2v6894 [Hermanssonia centrifuga]|uniref:HotDog ACOT-type domain-containing protein n=1 Tax=Hermanssonia centrifuga TaxID=98765 RepID=A0A2R6NYT1_9APHY|nr:hypothetical protein PHLCEN_2v6894 [Hermanssonia centrifuga]
MALKLLSKCRLRVLLLHQCPNSRTAITRLLTSSSSSNSPKDTDAAGAVEETQDVSTMDRLLRTVRDRANPAYQSLLPMKSLTKWSDTLTPTAACTTSPPSFSSSPAHDSRTARHMCDSYCSLTLPFSSSPDLLEAYTNTTGGIRTGKLMEHLDSLAGSIAYKHMLGPEEVAGRMELGGRGFYIVTASVDRLDMLAPLHPVRDMRLSGQVIYVGRSSMEVAVRMEALNLDGTEETIMLGRFCMVARDSETHKACAVNPLVASTAEEEALLKIGKVYAQWRGAAGGGGWGRAGADGGDAVGEDVDDVSSGEKVSVVARGEGVADGPSVHQKIFGGYLMRLAYELGYSNAMLFTRGAVSFLSLDSISFARPVPIGSVLRLKSYVLHTAGSEQHPALVHVGVKANVVEMRTGKEQLTNDFRFTWSREAALRRRVVPLSYQENALSVALATTAVTRELADMCQFPPVRAAAGLLLLIFQTIQVSPPSLLFTALTPAQDIQTNRTECYRLARRSLALLTDLRETMHGRCQDAPPSLLLAIHKFEHTLEEMHTALKASAEHKWHSRLIKKNSIEAAIADFNLQLDDAARSFQIATLINIQYELATSAPLCESPTAAASIALTPNGTSSDDEFVLVSTSDALPAAQSLQQQPRDTTTQQLTEEEAIAQMTKDLKDHGFRRFHTSDLSFTSSSAISTSTTDWWSTARDGVSLRTTTDDANSSYSESVLYMPYHAGTRTAAAQKWLQDVKILQNVHHPNLPQMIGYSGDSAPTPFILLANGKHPPSLLAHLSGVAHIPAFSQCRRGFRKPSSWTRSKTRASSRARGY